MASGKKSSKKKQNKKFKPEQANADGREGLIVGHYGVAVDVRFENGDIESVRVKRNSGHVVGDRVVVTGEILKRLSRDTQLRRRDYGGKIRTMVANLDVLGIVVATVPQTPAGFIERAVVSARAADITPFIVVNKTDLEGTEELFEYLREIYSDDIPMYSMSVMNGDGLDTIRDLFAEGHRGAFVGTTGVGKSSLLNELCPEIDLPVGDLNEYTGMGRHTTTTSTLHEIPTGGELIDTPGFRDFGLVNISSSDLALNFPGFEEALENECRFRDCKHIVEPGCAVIDAFDEGYISEDTYKNYMSMLYEIEEQEKLDKMRGNA